jgi:hypothetical protein
MVMLPYVTKRMKTLSWWSSIKTQINTTCAGSNYSMTIFRCCGELSLSFSLLWTVKTIDKLEDECLKRALMQSCFISGCVKCLYLTLHFPIPPSQCTTRTPRTTHNTQHAQHTTHTTQHTTHTTQHTTHTTQHTTHTTHNTHNTTHTTQHTTHTTYVGGRLLPFTFHAPKKYNNKRRVCQWSTK